MESSRHGQESQSDPSSQSGRPATLVAYLTGIVILRVEKVAQLGQQLGPHLQLALGSDGGDENAWGSRERRLPQARCRPAGAPALPAVRPFHQHTRSMPYTHFIVSSFFWSHST